jgi:hypothetical protein
MKLIFLVLFLIALFHLSLYYCNVDFIELTTEEEYEIGEERTRTRG